MNILVTGGAGYIGSATVRALMEAGHRPVVFDNLSKGHRGAVPQGVPFYKADIHQTETLIEVIKEHHIDAVVHFAALSLVGESGSKPMEYYTNNVAGTMSILKAMIACEVKNIVFSSTAAVYGEPGVSPISEEVPKHPINVYGRTKLMVETILWDYQQAYGLRPIALRYFNAAGAVPTGEIGEDHTPETHLIPIVMQVANGQREKITIFGEDYQTPDGTCVRDYIHVYDLAKAHVLALDSLQNGGPTGPFNVGYGKGYSVKEVVDACEQAVGKPIPRAIGARREGDPASLVADSTKIQSQLGFLPQYDDLQIIAGHAWKWHAAHPNGYGEERREKDR